MISNTVKRLKWIPFILHSILIVPVLIQMWMSLSYKTAEYQFERLSFAVMKLYPFEMLLVAVCMIIFYFILRFYVQQMYRQTTFYVAFFLIDFVLMITAIYFTVMPITLPNNEPQTLSYLLIYSVIRLFQMLPYLALPLVTKVLEPTFEKVRE